MNIIVNRKNRHDGNIDEGFL